VHRFARLVLLVSSAVAAGATASVTAVGASDHAVPAATAPHGALPYPLPAAPVQPGPCPPYKPPAGGTPPPLPAPIVPARSVPLVGAPPPRHVDLSAISGKGMWLTLFPGDTLNVARVVAIAHAAELHQLWIRTGSSHDGFFGGPALAALLPAAHARGIDVIAWDFPTLSDPAADAARAVATLRTGVDGFSADIEENPEGTYTTRRRVAYYLSIVRLAAGNRPIVATVPRPVSADLNGYPYATEARFVDAFSPMIYWSCNEPGLVTSIAIDALAKLRPVAPIGQDYNMADEGGRIGLPTGQEIWRFLDVARRDGAIGASLYDLESGGRADLAALGAYPWSP